MNRLSTTSTEIPRVLTTGAHALPTPLLERTEVLPTPRRVWWETVLAKFRLEPLVQFMRSWREAWALFHAARNYDVAITDGAPDVLTAACPKSIADLEAACH